MNENDCSHKQVMTELEQVGLGYNTPCSHPLYPVT